MSNAVNIKWLENYKVLLLKLDKRTLEIVEKGQGTRIAKYDSNNKKEGAK